jgi:hypothetical protein
MTREEGGRQQKQDWEEKERKVERQGKQEGE